MNARKPIPPVTLKQVVVGLPTAAVFAVFLGWTITRDWKPWGDEEHFLQTVRMFGDGVSIDLLRSYPEMSGPLTYLVYAAWGGIAGFETPTLRLLTPVIASVTIIVWSRFLRDTLCSIPIVLTTLATLILNPYFLGLSVFVFTDMLALLGLTLTALGVSRRSAWLAGAGLAIATCSRQYLAFLAPALAWNAIPTRGEPAHLRWFAATVAGMLPLGVLILLWGGNLAPDNSIRAVYTSEGLRFDPHAFGLYISAPAMYLLPLVCLVVSRPPRHRAAYAAGALAFLMLLVFPVEPSIAQIREGSTTVGFLHRAIALVASAASQKLFFASLAFVNCWAIASALFSPVPNLNHPRVREIDAFLWIGVVAFLLVMPFSYMPWEKYAIPLLMLQSVVLARSLDAPSPASVR